MFAKARLKLTAWYLVIIMTVSVMFSFAIYSSINVEFQRFQRVQLRIHQDLENGRALPQPRGDRFIFFGKPDPTVIADARKRLIAVLGIINLSILFIAGIAGYFLAGRTLNPIKKMVNEQRRFFTDASHELRTPLTALRTEIEVGLRNKKITLAQAQKLLKSNLEEVITLQALSDDLLTLSQNGKKIHQHDMSLVLLQEIAQTAVKKVMPFAKKKDITIQNKIKNLAVFGLKDRLLEVFVILLDNAIKYSEQGDKVELIAKKRDKTIEVIVKDYGIGIDKKDLPHIFDRFYRSDKSRSKTEGYGLGLAIAQKIMNAHNGVISVESKKNKGTIFKLIFRIVSDNYTK